MCYFHPHPLLTSPPHILPSPSSTYGAFIIFASIPCSSLTAIIARTKYHAVPIPPRRSFLRPPLRHIHHRSRPRQQHGRFPARPERQRQDLHRELARQHHRTQRLTRAPPRQPGARDERGRRVWVRPRAIRSMGRKAAKEEGWKCMCFLKPPRDHSG